MLERGCFVNIATQELRKAHQIIESLEDATYAEDFQVQYDDFDALASSLARVGSLPETVTSPREIDSLSQALARIAVGEDKRKVVITGNCSERIVDPEGARVPTQRALQELHAVASVTSPGNILHIRRDRGQNTKPRSSEYETVNEMRVPSYMGDAINSPDISQRLPDPSRLTAAAMQALALERNMSDKTGRHVPAAHEALNLYYEMPFIRKDSKGREYLVSADLPWIGVRTNQVDSRHVDLLSRIENSVGVKIDAASSFDHLASLSERLNPTRKLGKIAWMLRIGLDDLASMEGIVGSLAEIEERPILMYDIHGSTIKRKDGAKIRAVEDIKAEIEQLFEITRQQGVELTGVHLETTMEDRLECVDTREETPSHEGGIDPQLNRNQTRRVLRHFFGLFR